MMEEEIIDVERKLVGRTPYHYHLDANETTLKADSGFGKVGAKMDPKTGALMYEQYEDWITKQMLQKEEKERESIRFSKDSKAMITFQEKEKVIMAQDGNIIEHLAGGLVSVENLSAKDRIWDIDVGLMVEGLDAALDFDSLSAKELEPGERKSREYRLNLMEPSIALEEVVSTHPDHPQSFILKKGQITSVSLQLGVKNLDTIPYSDLIISKEVPLDLKNIIFPGEDAEDVSIEEGRLVWRFKRLDPGQVKVLRYEGDMKLDEPEPVPTGDIIIKAVADDLSSTVVVTSFEAMCRNMYFIEADETEEPGEWACRFVCENTSQFEVEILRVEVQDPQTNQVYMNLDRTGTYVEPQGRWESETWLVTHRDRPTFIKNMVLNIVPGITKKTEYALTRKGGDFLPGAISFRKNFDRRQVEAKRETDITSTMFIENTGAADLEQIIVRDIVPRYMIAPDPSSIVIEREGMRLTDNIGVTVEPADEGPNVDKQMYIRIDDLSAHGGPLRKGEMIAITYKARVFRPEPNTTITAPAEVDARPYLPGPVLNGEDTAGVPVVDVTQILRRFSIGKSIEQGTAVGQYHIELLYRNRGNAPVTGLQLKDLIPENFTGGPYSIEPDIEHTPEGIKLLSWNIPKIDAGETLVISYTIKGEGEYHPRDAQVFYNAS